MPASPKDKKAKAKPLDTPEPSVIGGARLSLDTPIQMPSEDCQFNGSYPIPSIFRKQNVQMIIQPIV